MSEDAFGFLKPSLDKRKNEGLERHLSNQENNFSDFYSNDFLGLAKKNWTINNIESGSTGSRLISGNFSALEDFERELATDYGFPEALLFNSGYTCNLGVISALPQKGDVILYDAHVHASIKEAFRMCRAKFYSYSHNDFNDLERQLEKYADQRCWVVTESVFSMHGTVTKKEEITELIDGFNAFLIVDEAHAVGVTGPNNLGSFSFSENTIKIITFGKAYGAQGAAVLCSPMVKKYLVNFSRPFIYTTAMSPVLLEVIKHQHRTVMSANEERSSLSNKFRYFRTKVLQKNLRTGSGESPIQMWYPKHTDWERIKDKFSKEGISIKVILPPTVPEGDEGVRIILHSYNTLQEIDKLLQTMEECNRR